MLRKKILYVLIASSLSATPQVSTASIWGSTKEMVNNAIPWKQKHLEEISFEEIYPKKFYKKSSFFFVATGAMIVTAGTISFFTAGAGAPAAAAGVSSAASMIAGGGAGSYMAGLSAVGGWFGGNAILGAAILNGISLGTIGGASSWGALSVAAKAGVLV